VDELHAGDAGADDDEVVGHLGRRVGLAGGEDALAVDGGPVGDAWAAAGGEHDHVGFDLLEAVGGLGNDLVGALEHSGALDEPDVLVLEQRPGGAVDAVLDAGQAGGEVVDVDPGADVAEAHALGPG